MVFIEKKSLNCDKQPHPAQIVVPDLMGHRSAVFHKVAETATAVKQSRIRSVCFGFTFFHRMKNTAETLKTMKIMLRLGLGTICHCVCLRERVKKRQGERGK